MADRKELKSLFQLRADAAIMAAAATRHEVSAEFATAIEELSACLGHAVEEIEQLLAENERLEKAIRRAIAFGTSPTDSMQSLHRQRQDRGDKMLDVLREARDGACPPRSATRLATNG